MEAAGGLTMAHPLTPQFELKRKRYLDDESVQDLQTHKRPDLKQLPIRSPPLSRSFLSPTSQHSQTEQQATPFNGVEIEGFQHNRPSTPQRSSGRTVSITLNGRTTVDDAVMDTTPPSRTGRARSNDLMSPVRSVSFPHPTISLHDSTYGSSPRSSPFARERVPTPMASTFSSALQSPLSSHFFTHAPRISRPQMLQTALSPFTDAESWTPQQQHSESPILESYSSANVCGPNDQDTEMLEMEDSNMMSSSFGNLSVHATNMDILHGSNMAYLGSSPSRPRTAVAGGSERYPGLGLRSGRDLPDEVMDDPSLSQRRVPRLQMGFRADCEKCVDRVPGHYSHILWT